MWTQVRAALVPLIVVAVAVALWWASDRIGHVGPLDKAMFGWLFLVPIWAASPAAAGVAWRGLAATARRRAAIADGLLLGGVSGFLLWLGVVTADCQLGLARTPLEFVPPAIVCGVATGVVFGFGLSQASGQAAAGHPLRSIAVGAAAQLALILIIPTIAFIGFFGVCARP
jgi:hypothetical protein